MSIDRYESPETLAMVSGAPEMVCRMIFAAAPTRQEIEAVRSDCRKDELCRVRFAIVFAAREYAGATFSQIGRAINRDGNGSWISRSYVRARHLVKHDKAFRSECHRLREVIQPREALRLKARTGN